MRFAIWAAVSSEAQAAPDKVSLEEQIELCRQAAATRGWLEACPPFIAPGASRTRFVNLSDAEREIPPLHALLEAAKRRQIDLVMMYDYDRLRDLLPMVVKSLDDYRVQTFAVNQAIEPVAPDQYVPFRSDTMTLTLGMKQLVSKVQMADMHRKYADNMPKRAQRGLPVQVPYGYQRVDRKNPPIVDQYRAQYVIMAKDLLLSGASMREIETALVEAGAPPPTSGGRWWQQTIRAMLRNPFYAGQVRWGASRVEHDSRAGTKRRDRGSHPGRTITAAGRHEALWDQATHRRILDELARRGKHYPGRRRNQLSGLLHCGACDSRMWVSYRVPANSFDDIIWACSAYTGHPRVKHPEALSLVGAELRRMVLESPPEPVQEPPSHEAEMKALVSRRERIMDAYEGGAYPLKDYVERVSALETEIERLAARIADTAAWESEQTIRRQTIADLKTNADLLPRWLSGADPKEVNHILAMLLERITFFPDRVELRIK